MYSVITPYIHPSGTVRSEKFTLLDNSIDYSTYRVDTTKPVQYKAGRLVLVIHLRSAE
jgi:hypothetical protein